jgi:hypothetical protein
MTDLDSEPALLAAQAHRTLEDVIFYCTASKHAKLEKVLVQDEYTHDVVVKVGDDRWLVYDTT